MEEKNCISCKKRIVNDHGHATFLCPSCGKYELTRCTNCRTNATKFKCPQCGFIGPN